MTKLKKLLTKEIPKKKKKGNEDDFGNRTKCNPERFGLGDGKRGRGRDKTQTRQADTRMVEL